MYTLIIVVFAVWATWRISKIYYVIRLKNDGDFVRAIAQGVVVEVLKKREKPKPKPKAVDYEEDDD